MNRIKLKLNNVLIDSRLWGKYFDITYRDDFDYITESAQFVSGFSADLKKKTVITAFENPYSFKKSAYPFIHSKDFKLILNINNIEKENFVNTSGYYIAGWRSVFSNYKPHNHITINDLNSKHNVYFAYSNGRSQYRTILLKHICDTISDINNKGKVFNNVKNSDTRLSLNNCNSKLGLAFENSLNIGYITEKILVCYLRQTVPVYYGNKENIEIMKATGWNPGAFIDVSEYTPDKVVSVLKDYLNNPEEIIKKYNQPLFFSNHFERLDIKMKEIKHRLEK